MTSRPPTAAPILAVLAIVLVTLGAYVIGYIWLGAFSPVFASSSIVAYKRNYRREWQREIFQPAARLESWLNGVEVRAVCEPSTD